MEDFEKQTTETINEVVSTVKIALTPTMTMQEAYADFYAWIRADVKRWNDLEMSERRYLRKTSSEVRLGKPVGNLRIENIFKEYAPGRYKLNEATFTKI